MAIMMRTKRTAALTDTVTAIRTVWSLRAGCATFSAIRKRKEKSQILIQKSNGLLRVAFALLYAIWETICDCECSNSISNIALFHQTVWHDRLVSY